MRFQASTCSGLYMPVQPGVMRPSRLTSVISAMTRAAPPTAGERLRHLGVTLERTDERDRVLHRQLRPRADREVRGVRRVAHQHHVRMVPAAVADGGEIAPERAVLEEPVAPELGGEEALAEGERLILVGPVEAGLPPGGLGRLEDE